LNFLLRGHQIGKHTTLICFDFYFWLSLHAFSEGLLEMTTMRRQSFSIGTRKAGDDLLSSMASVLFRSEPVVDDARSTSSFVLAIFISPMTFWQMQKGWFP